MTSMNFDDPPQPEEGDGSQEETPKPEIPEVVSVLPLRNVVVYPSMVIPVTVSRPRSLKLIEDASSGDRVIGVVTLLKSDDQDPRPHSVYQVGVVAQILRLMRAPDGNIHILIQGLDRVVFSDWVAEEPYMRARVSMNPEVLPHPGDIQLEALRDNMVTQFQRLVSLMSYMPDELAGSVGKTKDFRTLAYLVASSIRMDLPVAQEVLEMDAVAEKLQRLTEIINHELEVVELGRKIQSDAKTEMDKAQREYFLRQQLKAIQKELGEENESQPKTEEFRDKINASGMPEEARQEALRELSRMERIPEASAEYGVILTYLDWITSLPWQETTTDRLDIEHAREILDEDHYSLEKIKERILEYLAVRQLKQQRGLDKEEEENDGEDYLRKQREGVILCFVGPPGLGKTSLGQSIARALGRKFYRISLGGIRDEAEIRGHRRTYIGALPGRFIQALRRVQTKNPVIMLDEVDKVGSDWRGDPSSALLEVLDPEQNREFRDHYLDVPFDLSQVMFIATANLLDTIPGPLRDRLEVLELSGYTDDEKRNIAQKYLLPRQSRENGLRPDEIELTDAAVLQVIRDYTREAGVRSLERQMGTICRKAAVKVAKKEELSSQIDAKDLHGLLGKPRFSYDVAERTETPGVATGLAVTAVGGDILFVEATQMPGKKGLSVTGQLGDVMKESVEAAVSYVRGKAEELGIEKDFFEKTDIHVHIPAGATPKDGPSAGVTLVTALTSLLTGRPVSKEVGMTGEMTLRGQVLPVGGIKDKVLAAHRAGLKVVILPKRNEKDMEDIPESVREAVTFVLADNISQVLEKALGVKVNRG
ncbi:endopeptidase La [Acanthopleuribacter pedis]|uniref:Lon protease n=1 Tax=Acanthopleuribacter pedis TaxID=442870 RepID=A0A8J7QGE3_9BACT|nr:endopeptidase La [Acanthopleuribacter pedis]MBO1321795.1 endopeptidase La [Acanthopleuribacter pedis]